MSNPSSNPHNPHNPAPVNTECHAPHDKYDAPPSAAPPSALAAVAAAHPLMTPGAASSSSRPASLAMPHTMLSNIPLPYSYSSPSPNHPLNPSPLTSSVPPLHHHQTNPNTELRNLACLTQPVPNPLAHTLHPSHIPHSEPVPITQHHHPHPHHHHQQQQTQHQPQHQHHHLHHQQHHHQQHHQQQHHQQPIHSNHHHHHPHHHAIATSLPHTSALTAAATAVAAAAVATPSEREIPSHPDHPNDPNLTHHPASAIHTGTTLHHTPTIHPAPPIHRNPTIHTGPTIHAASPVHPSSTPIQSTSIHPPTATPYPPMHVPVTVPVSVPMPVPISVPVSVSQPQRQPSPTNSEVADAPSTDAIGPGSTGGGASTVGAASIDGAGGLSGSSSGNVTDDRAPQLPSAAPTPPDVGAVSAPPSNGRRRQGSPVDSPDRERPNKRPHRSISHAEKRRLCEISNANPSAKHGHIASVFLSETGRRIERSTVTRVLQRKEFWLSAGTRDSNRKRLTSPRFPSIEEALFELIRNHSRLPHLRCMLTDKELMKYSKDIADVMRNDNGSMDKNSPNYAPHLRSFRGSLSWVTSFKKRNALMPPEESKTYPVRPFVSSSLPGEALDIWQTELDVVAANNILSECTRMEDMYFLDAVALAASARPENVTVSSRVTPMNYESTTAAIDEAFGIVEPQNQDREPSGHEANASAIPQIDFSMPILSSNAPGMPNAMSTNDNSNEQNGMPTHVGDNYPGMSSAMNHSHPGQGLPEPRHPVDEDTIAYALFCSNAVGNDKRQPWLVGKKAFIEVGSNPGEVWPGCPVRYFHNKQGWITGRLTRKWVEEFDKSVDRNVVVVTSLLNSCDLELVDLKHVTVLPIPRTEPVRDKEAAMAWTSASASPMHHGIEQMFRAKYRCLVMERALQLMGQDKPLKNLPMRMVATTLKEAWDKVPVPVIRRAWRELPYLPATFNRSTNRPRSNNKPMWGQTLVDLSRLLMTYRDAISSYKYADEIDLRQSDICSEVTDLCDYIWISVEEGPFHPSGSILEFARSACTNTPAKEEGIDQAKVVKPVERRSFQIENHEDALELINKLANFIKSDPSLGNQQNLYLAGSLQLEVKKECDRRRNEAEARNWIEANRQRSSGLP